MRVILATPLFPPDIGGAAPYSKELAERLAKAGHAVTVVTYGHLPEPVEGVEIIPVDKRQPLPVRLFRFASELRQAVRRADIIYAENGPSVEVPLLLTLLFSRTPLIFHIGDPAAHEYAQQHFLRRMIENLVIRRAKTVIEEKPHERPEILPFQPYPQEELDAYERSWNAHMRKLTNTFTHV